MPARTESVAVRSAGETVDGLCRSRNFARMQRCSAHCVANQGGPNTAVTVLESGLISGRFFLVTQTQLPNA